MRAARCRMAILINPRGGGRRFFACPPALLQNTRDPAQQLRGGPFVRCQPRSNACPRQRRRRVTAWAGPPDVLGPRPGWDSPLPGRRRLLVARSPGGCCGSGRGLSFLRSPAAFLCPGMWHATGGCASCSEWAQSAPTPAFSALLKRNCSCYHRQARSQKCFARVPVVRIHQRELSIRK